MRRQYIGDKGLVEKGGLEEARVLLEEWRVHHKAPTPIPQELWCKAVDLAGQYGVGQTARTLRLDYAALKRRVSERTIPLREAPAEFIELLSPVSAGIAECALEVEAAQGARMRIVMKNVAPKGLATILRDFVA